MFKETQECDYKPIERFIILRLTNSCTFFFNEKQKLSFHSFHSRLRGGYVLWERGGGKRWLTQLLTLQATLSEQSIGGREVLRRDGWHFRLLSPSSPLGGGRYCEETNDTSDHFSNNFKNARSVRCLSSLNQ